MVDISDTNKWSWFGKVLFLAFLLLQAVNCLVTASVATHDSLIIIVLLVAMGIVLLSLAVYRARQDDIKYLWCYLFWRNKLASGQFTILKNRWEKRHLERLMPDMRAWAKETLRSDFRCFWVMTDDVNRVGMDVIFFKSDSDAVMFKIRWGEDLKLREPSRWL